MIGGVKILALLVALVVVAYLGKTIGAGVGFIVGPLLMIGAFWWIWRKEKLPGDE